MFVYIEEIPREEFDVEDGYAPLTEYEDRSFVSRSGLKTSYGPYELKISNTFLYWRHGGGAFKARIDDRPQGMIEIENQFRDMPEKTAYYFLYQWMRSLERTSASAIEHATLAEQRKWVTGCRHTRKIRGCDAVKVQDNLSEAVAHYQGNRVWALLSSQKAGEAS